MIEARYKNGIVYTCHEWEKLDIAAMQMDGLESLRIDPYRWHAIAHGTPKNHTLRRLKNIKIGDVAKAENGQDVPSVDKFIYVMETNLWKIFVFSDGGMSILRDWDNTSAIFCSPDFAGQEAARQAKKGNGKK